MSSSDDLWPANIADSRLTTPVAILKEQARLLGEKTAELVKGEVITQPTNDIFIHYFYITAPTLKYRYELFTVSHGVSFYPLTIRQGDHSVKAATEESFRDNLKQFLSSQHSVNVVHSILAQVRS